jgi:hypothetical protein
MMSSKIDDSKGQPYKTSKYLINMSQNLSNKLVSTINY